MTQATVSIADVQGGADQRRLAINKVGIKDIRHPVRLADRDGEAQHTVATVGMYVNLAHHVRGTHMSRFLALLNEPEQVISVANFGQLLTRMTGLLDADYGEMELSFPFFVDKQAPVSGVRSLLDYDVTLAGEVSPRGIATSIRVVVPVTSLCPCSKEISDYGAHNQRSHVTVVAHLAETVWLQELIDLIEEQASCELYGLLKRPDEKYVTERAYDNPKFVEDMVRDVAARLQYEPRIKAFSVASENFESIHNHSAYAMIEQDKTATGPAQP